MAAHLRILAIAAFALLISQIIMPASARDDKIDGGLRVSSHCYVDNPGQGAILNGIHYFLSEQIFRIDDDVNGYIKDKYGPSARIADWVEISKIKWSTLKTFSDSIGIIKQTAGSECFNALVTVDDSLSPDGITRYSIARHNGALPSQWPSVDQIGRNYLKSWQGGISITGLSRPTCGAREFACPNCACSACRANGYTCTSSAQCRSRR